jgi:hypothetical protein
LRLSGTTQAVVNAIYCVKIGVAGSLTNPRTFNLMFDTSVGPVAMEEGTYNKFCMTSNMCSSLLSLRLLHHVNLLV